jgi:rhodanese-related sulfurtransferase
LAANGKTSASASGFNQRRLSVTVIKFIAMQNITVEEVKSRIGAGESLHLIDVREPFEHDEFNIGGILYPLGKVQTMEVDELESLKNQELIVYCRSGNRSGQACMILDMLGFTNTKNLVGGMMDWTKKFGNGK